MLQISFNFAVNQKQYCKLCILNNTCIPYTLILYTYDSGYFLSGKVEDVSYLQLIKRSGLEQLCFVKEKKRHYDKETYEPTYLYKTQ